MKTWLYGLLSVLLLLTSAKVSNIEAVQETLNLTLDSAYTHVFATIEASTNRKRSGRGQARHQTPGACGRACFGAGHPGFKRQVVKFQRVVRLCRPATQSRR